MLGVRSGFRGLEFRFTAWGLIRAWGLGFKACGSLFSAVLGVYFGVEWFGV